MRQVSLEPQPGPAGVPRARTGAALPVRLLGLLLLSLAIVVPGCQAVIFGSVPAGAPEAAAQHGR